MKRSAVRVAGTKETRSAAGNTTSSGGTHRVIRRGITNEARKAAKFRLNRRTGRGY